MITGLFALQAKILLLQKIIVKSYKNRAQLILLEQKMLKKPII